MKYLFTLDVVRSAHGELIIDGLNLLSAIQELGVVVLISPDSGKSTDRFTKINGIRPDFVSFDFDLDSHRYNGHINTLFTADPSYAAESLSKGITTCLVGFPKVSVPAQEPGSLSWLEIVAEIERQAGIYVSEEDDEVEED